MSSRVLLYAALVGSLVACATQNMPGTDSYIAVPDSQMLSTVPLAGTDIATIVAKRDPGFYGAGLSSALTVNGKQVAVIKPGQYLTFQVPADDYLFGVAWSDDLGSLATKSTREIAVDCKAGKTYVLRMFPQTGSGIVIERASQ